MSKFDWTNFKDFNAVAQKALVLADVKHGDFSNRNIFDVRDATGVFHNLMPDFLDGIKKEINDFVYERELLVRAKIDVVFGDILNEMDGIVPGSGVGLTNDYIKRFNPEPVDPITYTEATEEK